MVKVVVMEKTCRGPCGRTLPVGVDHFYQHPQMRDGFLNYCRDCHNAANRARQANFTPEQRTAERDRLAAWRAANPDRWKELRAAADVRYANSDKGKAKRRRREERVQAARAGNPVVRLADILARDGRTCGICRRPIDERDEVAFDHVVPLARGGAHAPDNLRPAHRSCNSWKGDRLDEELVGLTPPAPGEVDDWQARRREKANEARRVATKARMDAMTPEERAERGRKISEAKKGKPWGPGHAPKPPRTSPVTDEERERRRQAGRVMMAAMTPEQRAARGAKISATKKARGQGNADNLRKGHDPEVRARAIQASADARRGVALTDQHRAGIADGMKRQTPEQLEARTASVRATYAGWTDQQRAAHAEKVLAGKARAAGQGTEP